MVIAMAAFTFNDAVVKLLTETIPVAQIIFLRGVLTTIIIITIIYVTGQITAISTLKRPVIWYRAGMEVGATFCFLTALKHIPIGNAAAILSALPLAVTIGSSLFLGEAVGWRRWIAIIVGFSGVLLIVRPGLEGFSSYSFLVLAAVVFAAARDLITRTAPKEIPSLLLTLSTSLAITISGGVYTFGFINYQPMTNVGWISLTSAAVFLTAAYFFIVAAVRTGEIAIVAPFRYTNLIWAIILGVLLFGDEIDQLTIIGATLIVATGIYTLYRERVRARENKRQTVP